VKWSTTRDRRRVRWYVETLHVLLDAGDDPPPPGRHQVAALLGQILRGKVITFLPCRATTHADSAFGSDCESPAGVGYCG
jgi:hypothetical protein